MCLHYGQTLNKIFRRDQIRFCEKDQFGATALYSLAERKKNRKQREPSQTEETTEVQIRICPHGQTKASFAGF
jgi:hypothetical protein